jgi:cell division septum initiation protein DivIVA
MSRFRKPTDITEKKRDLQTDTAARLEAIVEAAERAAESVIDDAEAQARRYLAQARAEADRQSEGQVAEVSGLVDSLLSQATSLRHEAERLQQSLEVAKTRIAGGDPPPQEPAENRAEAPRLRAVEVAEPARPPAVEAAEPPAEEPQVEPDPRRADAAGARLLATQLAVSGSSREEIAQRLRNGFEIEDTDAILDAILGPEG